MKFPPAPILALLALGEGCALAPPSSNSAQGGNTISTPVSSAGSAGSGGVIHLGGSSAIPLSGGNTAARDAGVTGGSLAIAGTTTAGGATSTGSTPFGGSAPTGGTTSGSTATGGSATGGASGGASGGNASGGTSAHGGTFTGGTMTGGSTTGGSMTGGSKSGGTRTAGATASGGASGGSATGGSASGGGSTYGTHSQPTPITNGTSGFTTRYWDCCKPSCGWAANANNKPVHTCGKDGTSTVDKDTQSACSSGSGYMCYWGAPWSVSDTLSFGFAAYNGVDCGTCFQIQFTGKGQYNGGDPGSVAIKNKTMIVQVINIGGIAANQFDLLIPGGGVGANNACTGGSAQWSNVDIGDTNGGMLTTCKDDKSCVQQKCQAAFGNMPQLLAGCNWVTGWFAAADNPQMVYQKIACPPEISAKSGE